MEDAHASPFFPPQGGVGRLVSGGHSGPFVAVFRSCEGLKHKRQGPISTPEYAPRPLGHGLHQLLRPVTLARCHGNVCARGHTGRVIKNGGVGQAHCLGQVGQSARPRTNQRSQILPRQEWCLPRAERDTGWTCQHHWARPASRKRVSPCQAAALLALLRLLATTSRTLWARLPSFSTAMNWASRASAWLVGSAAVGLARRAAAS